MNWHQYSIPWTFKNGKKVRFIDIWAQTIGQAVKVAHWRIEPGHIILVDKVRRIK